MSGTAMRDTAVGLVGAGGIAPVHLEALAELPWVRIVGVCDLDRARAEALAARRPGTAVVASLGSLCDAGATAIHVLTPPGTHAALALEALERGCDVLVEKPLATSVADCDRLADAAARAGRRVGVNHSLLFDPWIARLRAAVAAGRIGTPVSATYACTAEYPPWAGGPVPPQYRDGGYPFRDLGVHGLYLLRAVLGEIEALQVERRGTGADPNLAFDDWHAIVRCERGVGTIRLSWGARPLETAFEVHGERGTLRADVGCMYLGRRLARGLPSPVARTVHTLEDALAAAVSVPRNVARLAAGRLRGYEGVRAAIAAFHRALADGGPLPASLEDGRAVVRWVEEAARPADVAKRQRAARHAARRRDVAVVTGASGRLGGALVRRLVAADASVRAVIRRPPPAWLLHPNVEVVFADLGDADAVTASLADARVVYHVGAAMAGGAEEHERATVAGTRYVVDACLAHGVPRLVHVSSLSVLHWSGIAAGTLVTEEAPLEPHPEARGHYTRAKLAAEQTVRAAAAERGLPAIVVRPGQIVGPGFLTAGTVDGIRAGRWLVVLGAGATALPLVHVDDAVDLLLRAGRSAAPPGTLYHAVDPRQVSRRALADVVARAAGVRVLCVPDRVVHALAAGCELMGRLVRRTPPLTRYRARSAAAVLRFDCTRTFDELGWQPCGPLLSPASAARPDDACEGAAAAPAADTPTTSPGRDAEPVAATR